MALSDYESRELLVPTCLWSVMTQVLLSFGELVSSCLIMHFNESETSDHSDSPKHSHCKVLKIKRMCKEMWRGKAPHQKSRQLGSQWEAVWKTGCGAV